MRTITATRGERRADSAPLSIGDNLVGRDTDVGLFLDDPRISRHHALIRFDGRRMILHALGPGVMVNGCGLDPGQELEFQLGEWIAIGPFVLIVSSNVARCTVDTVPADAPESGVRADDAGLEQWGAVATFERGPRMGERVRLEITSGRIGGPSCVLGLALAAPAAELYVEFGRPTLAPPATPSTVPLLLGGRPLRTYTAVQPSDLLTVGPHAFRFTSEPLWTPTLPAESVGGMIGNSEVMRQVYGSARRMALHDDVNVLIGGPTGTGKELLARAIHDLSPRAAGPFIPINCAELSEELVESILFGHAKGAFTGATHSAVGAFREAEGGTLFLDEFGTLSLPMQAKLLRALADRSVRRVGEAKSEIVNTRVVIATNVDLVRAVKEGTFREDLLYRICALVIHMPPLTSRKDDIPLLARWFLAQRHPSMGLSESAIARLLDHPWPGNVRELFQVLTAAAVAEKGGGQVIRPEHIVFIEEVYALAKVAPPPVFDRDVRTLVPKPLSELTVQEWRAERTLLSERERGDMRGVKRGTVRYWDQVHQAKADGVPGTPRRRKKKRIPGLEDEE